VLAEPFFEGLKVTVAVVLDALLVVLGVELESGVATDRDAVNFVGGSIEFGNHEVLDVADGSAELLPNGGESLAVATPGSVELHKHILVRVLNNAIEIGADQDSHVALLGRLSLRLEVGSEFALLVVVNEGLD